MQGLNTCHKTYTMITRNGSYGTEDIQDSPKTQAPGSCATRPHYAQRRKWIIWQILWRNWHLLDLLFVYLNHLIHYPLHFHYKQSWLNHIHSQNFNHCCLYLWKLLLWCPLQHISFFSFVPYCSYKEWCHTTICCFILPNILDSRRWWHPQ